MQPAPLGRSGARAEGAAAGEQALRLRFYFASPKGPELQAAVAAIADPSSQGYRHYLTVSQFRALYAPPATTTAALNAYLTSFGLTVGPLDHNGMSEPVSGRVKQFNAALHTTMQRVLTAHGAQVVGSIEAPAVPAGLASSISYVDGLTPWLQVHDHVAPTSRPTVVKAVSGDLRPATAKPAISAGQECSQLRTLGAGSSPEALDPADLSSAYNLAGFYTRGDTGGGTTVGLIEYDSFDQPAVTAWAECLGVSPTIYVYGDTTYPPPSAPQTVEGTLDVETVMDVAPSARIAVYETANVDGVDLDPWTAAIGGVNGIPLPAVISSSWGLCESAAIAQPGGSSLYAAESSLFSEAVTQGQTVLVASGDQGSEGCYDPTAISPNENLAVNDPASNPLVTGVGGTDTATVTGAQYVWNTPSSSQCASPSDCIVGASGGGLSSEWDQPTYQPARPALQTGCVSGGGSDGPYGGITNGGCREVPDVSALAGYPYWGMCTNSGANPPCPVTNSPGGEYFIGGGGTSLAAPSWAATVALADASCPRNVGFLNPLLYRYAGNNNTIVGAVTSGGNDFTGTNNMSYPASVDGSQNLATGLGYLGGVDLSTGALCSQPGAPAALRVAPGDGSITLSWTPPKYDGGSNITGYTATATPGGATCTTSTTSCQLSGLTNGSPYRVAVTATNSSATGLASTQSGWVTPAPHIAFPGFSPVGGTATAVSEGANGSVWVIGNQNVYGGHPIFERTTGGWIKIPGGAVAIAVGPSGLPWVVNNLHQIFQRTSTGWKLEPGAATAISVGANGAVWVVGTNAVGGGHGLFSWTGTGWAVRSGGAVAIAVGPTGSPWVINNADQIFQWNGSGWNPQAGWATTISEGADGAVWVLGGSAVGGGHPLFLWNGAGWTVQPGGAVAIAVGPNGMPWVTNSGDHIFQTA
jgi:subtilase family serine protease